MGTKRFTILVGLLIVSAVLTAQGIAFNNNAASWNEVLLKAKQSNKPVFVDVYTAWCGPCKWMDKNVFNQREVSAFYNQNFISLKLDAEKGFGVSFAKENRVNAFPTYLFFSPEGEVLLTGIGAMPKAAMVQSGKNALANWASGVTLQDMMAKAATGTNDPAFLQTYITRLSSTGLPNAYMIEEYLKVIPEDSLYTAATLKLVTAGYFGRMPANGRAFKVLLQAYKQYRVKSWELMSPHNTIRNRLHYYADSAGKLMDTAWLQEIQQAVELVDEDAPLSAAREKALVSLMYFAGAKDTVAFKRIAQDFILQQIVEINPDSLAKWEVAAFKDVLQIKFKTTDITKLQRRQDYLDFIKGYRSESRLIAEDLLSVIWMGAKLNMHTLDFSQALEAAIKLYESSTVPINEYFLKSIKDQYKNSQQKVPTNVF